MSAAFSGTASSDIDKIDSHRLVDMNASHPFKDRTEPYGHVNNPLVERASAPKRPAPWHVAGARLTSGRGLVPRLAAAGLLHFFYRGELGAMLRRAGPWG